MEGQFPNLWNLKQERTAFLINGSAADCMTVNSSKHMLSKNTQGGSKDTGKST